MTDPPRQSRPGGARHAGDRVPIAPIGRGGARGAAPPTAPTAPGERVPAEETDAGAGESRDRVRIAPIARARKRRAARPAPAAEPRTGVQPWHLAAVAGVVVAAAAALAIVLVREAPPGDGPSEVAAARAAVESPPSGERRAAEPERAEARPPPPPATREEAVQLLSAYQKLAAALAPHAERWAGERYRSAQALAREGEQALLGGDSTQAAARFRDGLEILEQLEEEKPRVLADALQGGFAALSREDGALARERFELAAAIDPDNARAVRGLERVATLGDVVAATSAGAAREGEGDWNGAREAYAKALDLDPEWEPAREGQTRVASRLTEIQFDQHLAAGTRELEAGRWQAARKSLRAALALRGDSREARAGLRRAEAKIREASLARARDAARSGEASEDWSGAVRHYRAALALDGKSRWAQDGLARSQRRLALDQQIRRTLGDPARLYRDAAALADAQKLAAAVAQVPKAGPRLRAQRDKLRASIERASTPRRDPLRVRQSDRSDDRAGASTGNLRPPRICPATRHLCRHGIAAGLPGHPHDHHRGAGQTTAELRNPVQRGDLGRGPGGDCDRRGQAGWRENEKRDGSTRSACRLSGPRTGRKGD